jgi:GntR family transcriptional regulator, transcriptional repressor for pyruvate dehydrogenase complex
MGDEMNFKRIKPKKIYEQVAETLYEMISSGKLKQGDKLDSVQQLAVNFEVGQAAIREALASLRTMGLIEIKHGEGTFVREFEPGKMTLPALTLLDGVAVENLFELRKIIEVGAAISAAKKRKETHLQKMEVALKKMEAKCGKVQFDETADFEFHLVMAEASGNPLLLGIMDQVSGLLREMIKETSIRFSAKGYDPKEYYHEHILIYEAICAQNEEKARESILLHLENVECTLNKVRIKQSS